MNRIYQFRPGMKWWADSGPANSGWSYSGWECFPIHEKRMLVMITPKVACTSLVRGLIQKCRPDLYEIGVSREELVEQSRRFSVWHSICVEYGIYEGGAASYPDYEVVGLIRNPIDRFWSGFKAQGDGADSQALVPHTLDVIDFLIWMIPEGPFKVDKHFAPQWRGWPERASLFPLEDDAGLNEFLSRIGLDELPRENVVGGLTGHEGLTKHVRATLEVLYREDLRVWSACSAHWKSQLRDCKKEGVPARSIKDGSLKAEMAEESPKQLEVPDGPTPADVLRKIEDLSGSLATKAKIPPKGSEPAANIVEDAGGMGE
jgi:hypothetical protein